MTGSAAIIGGGIGGLATAKYLAQHGWHVDVFERAAALPETGTALGMWPEALAALDSLGVGDRVRSIGSQQRRGEFRRSDGSVIARFESHRGTAVLISRPPLLRILADGVPNVHFGTPIDEIPSGYDVVVGADGVNSTVRTTVVGHRVDPEYLGVSALIGWAPGGTDTVAETWGEERIFGISPRDGDRTNWFAAYREPLDTEPPARPAEFLRREFGHWHADVRDILDRLDEESIIHYRIKQMPPLPSYVAGNVALIGDAAHAMAPNIGRGACETLVDAVTLGTMLVEHGVSDGLERYDRRRRKTTQRLVRTARAMNRLATARRFTQVRDVVVRTAVRIA